MNKNIQIYTDGSSLGNPGRGGWGFVVVENDKIIKEAGGYHKDTTNNRMELQAVIESFKYISTKQDLVSDITIFADSNYVLNGVTSWVYNWEKNGWRTANKKEVLNQDLWKELIDLYRKCHIKIIWQKVKGHSGHIYNDKADEIATNCAEKQKKIE